MARKRYMLNSSKKCTRVHFEKNKKKYKERGGFFV